MKEALHPYLDKMMHHYVALIRRVFMIMTIAIEDVAIVVKSDMYSEISYIILV